MSFKEIDGGTTGDNTTYGTDDINNFAKFWNGKFTGKQAKIVDAMLLSDTTVYGLGNVCKMPSVRRIGFMVCHGPESVGEGILKHLVHVGNPTLGSSSANGDYSIYQTGATINTSVGVRLPVSHIFRLRRNFRLKFKFSIDAATSIPNDCRLYAGFDTASSFPTTDTPLGATTDKGVIFGKAAGDTNFQIFTNDAVNPGETKANALGYIGSPPPAVPVDNGLHRIEIQSDKTNQQFLYSLDDGEFQALTTKIPDQDDQLYFRIIAQNATANNVTLSLYYIEAEISSGADLPWTNPPPTVSTGGLNSIAETFTNKTIAVDANIIKHSSTNILGDILANNGTSFQRRDKGTASQLLRVKADGSDIEWVDPSAVSMWNNVGIEAFNNKTISASVNTITDIGASLGDLLRFDGTSFKRLARGTPNQVLTTNAGGTDILWQAAASGGGNVNTAQVNTYADFDQVFRNGRLKIRDVTNTYSQSIFAGLGINADYPLYLPAQTASDVLVAAATIAQLSNKTINASLNVITDNSTVLGDILRFDGTSFKRLARGTANQVLSTNPAGTDIIWADPTGGTGTWNPTAVETLQNKTIASDQNTIKDSINNINGDLLVNNGTKFIRLARGAANQILTVAPDGLSIAWAASPGGVWSPTATETLQNKTISADLNTIKDSTTNAVGDLLVNNGTKYVRRALGAANQHLAVNSGGTDLVYVNPATSWNPSLAETLTNKTMDYNANTFQNFPSASGAPMPESGTHIGTIEWSGKSTAAGTGRLGQVTQKGTAAATATLDSTHGPYHQMQTTTTTSAGAGFGFDQLFTMRKYKPKLICKFGTSTNSNCCTIIGFTTNLSYITGSTIIASSESGCVAGYRSADSTWFIFHNDGTGTMTSDNQTWSLDTNIHTVTVYADDANSRFQVTIDAHPTVNVTTKIPTQTQGLTMFVYAVNNASMDIGVKVPWVSFSDQY